MSGFGVKQSPVSAQRSGSNILQVSVTGFVSLESPPNKKKLDHASMCKSIVQGVSAPEPSKKLLVMVLSMLFDGEITGSPFFNTVSSIIGYTANHPYTAVYDNATVTLLVSDEVPTRSVCVCMFVAPGIVSRLTVSWTIGGGACQTPGKATTALMKKISKK